MTKVSMSTKLGVPAQRVWDLIGGFNALSDWHPAVEKSELEEEGKTTVRRLTIAGGQTIVERLEHKDDKERLYSYSILSGPLPVADYVATLRVREDDDGGCTVAWSSEFNPAGAPEADAAEVIRGIYQAGFDNLKNIFGG